MSIFGFIGTGNMGGALARAAAKAIPAKPILLCNRTQSKADALASEIGAVGSSASEIAEKADFIFIGVKPQQLEECLAPLREVFARRYQPPVIVSMAAGTSIEKMRSLTGGTCPVIRIMPNTPAAIGEGILLCCPSPEVSSEQIDEFKASMKASGMIIDMDEAHIDAATSVSGCGPAFADIFAEALADGAVACGIPRKQAQLLAAQMLLGSARLMIERGVSPAVLKDEVCSPGGTTIEGVRVLEEGCMRAVVMNAVIAAFEANSKFK